MGKIKEEYSCALLLAMDLVGGKWKLRILWHIVHGDNRYSLLQKAIQDITDKMLTTQLREMEVSGLILRKIINEKPLHVQYDLSKDYSDLKVIVDALCELGKDYGKKNDIVVND